MNHSEEIKNLINTLVSQNGSDIHITAGRKPVIRVDGGLVVLEGYSIYTNEDVSEMLSVMASPEKRNAFKKDQEIDFAFDFSEKMRLRGNAYFQQGKIHELFA